MKNKIELVECEMIESHIYRYDNIYITFDEAGLLLDVFMTLNCAKKNIEDYAKFLIAGPPDNV